MILFDAHAHYDDGRFDAEYEGGAVAALRDAKLAGVMNIVNSGACLGTSRRALGLADLSVTDESLPDIYASVGIHPSETDSYESLDAAMAELEGMLSHPRAVAVGEIGLDYHYPDTDKEAQHELFIAQLELARKHKLPVVIHSRDAHGDTFDVLKNYKDLRLMLHCYSGSADMARQYSDMGFYFSFGGVLTFKNAVKSREAAAVIPRERLLLETDCPYLAPVPHRGKLNYSGYMPLTAAALGDAVGVTADEAALLTSCNAKRFFDIK